ncbi:MAG: helical backbone metal receptor [Halobaculum sp.]
MSDLVERITDADTTSEPTRIVSLAPSTTAVVTALGAGDRLVGVTAHCEADAPVVGGWLDSQSDRVADRDPDLVCTADPLQRDLRDELRTAGLPVHHVEPTTLPEVFAAVRSVGRAVGDPEAGDRLADHLRDRVQRVRAATPDPADGPVVYCEEWGDPPTAAGNWVPGAVRAAGCRYPFVTPGERSAAVTGEQVAAADPAHAVLHHCGHGEHAPSDLLADRGWELDAAVHVLDDDLLNQPSPRLVDGIERLAEIVHGVSPDRRGAG